MIASCLFPLSSPAGQPLPCIAGPYPVPGVVPVAVPAREIRHWEQHRVFQNEPVLYSFTGVIRFVFVLVQWNCSIQWSACLRLFRRLPAGVVRTADTRGWRLSYNKTSSVGGLSLPPYSPVPSLSRSLRVPIDAARQFFPRRQRNVDEVTRID